MKPPTILAVFFLFFLSAGQKDGCQRADSDLQASGLIGPVVIEAYDYRLLNGPTE